MAKFAHKAPKLNHGITARVNRLLGSSAAGASPHRTYQC